MRKGRAFAWVLALMLGLCCAAPAAKAEAEKALGDLDGDGLVSAADAAAALRLCAGGAPDASVRPDADLTQNGAIDETDARVALWQAAGAIPDSIKFLERIGSGLCSEKLFDRFSYNGVHSDGAGNYRSQNVSVTIVEAEAFGSSYTLADICVQDIACIQNAFGGGAYAQGTASMRALFDQCDGAIIAINGDFYTQHYNGPIVRDGVVYLNALQRDWDIAVLLTGGELVTCEYGKLTRETFDAYAAYQTWVFGPALLDDAGMAKTSFRSNVQSANPRSVIGYYEPGHYGFLTVDGRTRASPGLTMQQLSLLCEQLGFAAAYNLDGGRSSLMLAESGPLGEPFSDGRGVSDAIVICESAAYAETDGTE